MRTGGLQSPSSSMSRIHSKVDVIDYINSRAEREAYDKKKGARGLLSRSPSGSDISMSKQQINKKFKEDGEKEKKKYKSPAFTRHFQHAKLIPL